MARGLERGAVCLYRFPKPDKERPVLVLTRTGAIDRLDRVTIAPITSTVREVPSEVRLDVEDGMKGRCAANFYNLTTVPRAGLGRTVAVLGPSKMREACEALAFALGCDGQLD